MSDDSDCSAEHGQFKNDICALDGRVTGLDGRVTELEKDSREKDKRITKVEVIIESIATNVNDMSRIQKDEMLAYSNWARKEISANRKQDHSMQKVQFNRFAHITEIVIILALAGKLAGVY